MSGSVASSATSSLRARSLQRRLPIGAEPIGDGLTHVRVWAPAATVVDVVLPSRAVALEREADGYFSGVIPAGAGARYQFRLDTADRLLPDPASRFQPEGPHGPSEIVDPRAFRWTDDEWRGTTLPGHVIYELHIGTFTREGTFDAAVEHLPALAELGVTPVEVMPVAEFPGRHGWGYDGVYLSAAQSAYGGPEGFARFVEAAHDNGLGVILDVVYNHLGPEGNYLGSFGPYFTGRYGTPWGEAVNFDGPESDAVRHFFVSNALYWVSEYHVDALRLDAIHGIFDFSARHILQEIAEAVHEQAWRLGRSVQVIAESSLNDARTVTAPELGGHPRRVAIRKPAEDGRQHALAAQVQGDRNLLPNGVRA